MGSPSTSLLHSSFVKIEDIQALLKLFLSLTLFSNNNRKKESFVFIPKNLPKKVPSFFSTIFFSFSLFAQLSSSSNDNRWSSVATLSLALSLTKALNAAQRNATRQKRTKIASLQSGKKNFQSEAKVLS